MTARINRSLVFGVALGLMAGVGMAGTASVVTASARTAVPVMEPALMEDDMSDVAGAAMDLADAEAWLAELHEGNFANIFVIADDGSMRCGEVEANPGCAPLTAADKASAIAEAREAVDFALAAVQDAERSFAADKGDGAIEQVGYAR